jgi:hypothetical protein
MPGGNIAGSPTMRARRPISIARPRRHSLTRSLNFCSTREPLDGSPQNPQARCYRELGHLPRHKISPPRARHPLGSSGRSAVVGFLVDADNCAVIWWASEKSTTGSRQSPSSKIRLKLNFRAWSWSKRGRERRPRARGVGGWGARGLQTGAGWGPTTGVQLLFRSGHHCIAGAATNAHSLAFSSAIRRTSICRFVSSDSSGNILQKRSMLRRATIASSEALESKIARVVIIFASPNFFSDPILSRRGPRVHRMIG